MTTNKNSIEIKKVLLGALYNNYSKHQNIISEIILQLNHFDNTSSIDYAMEAAEYVLAYIQLGFSYLEHKVLFDTTLQNAGFSERVISNLQKKNTIISLNKDQLRILIGRWPASPHNSHTIHAAIHDIIQHVEKNEEGCFQYYTAKKDGCYTALYTLTITENSAIFNDVFKNKFYSLIKNDVVTENMPSP